MQQYLACPSKEVRPLREIAEVVPHHNLAILENVLRILKRLDQPSHIHRKGALMLVEQMQKLLRPLVLRELGIVVVILFSHSP